MENEQQDSLQMHLDYDGGNILKRAVRWSHFLGILGIVVMAILILVVALAGSVMVATFSKFAPGFESLAGAGGAIVIIIFVLLLGFCIYIAYMLYRFSALTRKGIELQDQAAFAKGMECLKTYFVLAGVVCVLSLLSNLFSLTRLF